MKKRLCWDYMDIFYTTKNVQMSRPLKPFTKADEKTLLDLDHNYGDKLLYDALNATWWNQTEVKVQDFWNEVCQ